MNYLKKPFFPLNKQQRLALSILIVLLIIMEISFRLFPKQASVSVIDYSQATINQIENQLDSIQRNSKKTFSYQSKKITSSDSLKNFNPNDLPKQGWERIGFSPRQAEVIMKYKQLIGGQFQSKEDIRKCYVISDEDYQRLAPFIQLPERTKKAIKEQQKQLAKRINYHNFNPNDLNQSQWEKMGFSSRQAEVIIKYKSILGGQFTTKEQLKKCYVISDEKYLEMAPYIILPERIHEQKITQSSNEITEKQKTVTTISKEKIILENFNPNDLSLEEWMILGFSERQATTILNFKRAVGGSFKDAKTLKRCYAISEEKFEEIAPFLIF